MAKSEEKHQGWRNYLVERGFQTRQIMRLLGLSFITLIVSTIALLLFYNQIIDSLMKSDLPFYLMPEESEELASQLPGLRNTLFTWMTIMSGINLFLVVIIGVFITKKLGGPLYRFKQIMKQIANGDLTVEVELRKGDEFQDLAEDISEAVARVQLMILAIKENVDSLKALHAIDTKNNAAEQCVIGIEDALAYFRTIEIPDFTASHSEKSAKTR